MVFYRKYRPQKIDELDNRVVRESLYSIFSKENSFHAFLFTGPKGLGKTSAARLVAKLINCENIKRTNNKEQKTILEPCNKCNQCVSIVNGNNLDVLEIDGASNRGIDEIRDLKEKIKLAPFKAKKKVYIIDEVHMLTTEAFNALLKTLEEPPGHAVFILCTTEPHKVPATIASRCLRINFTKATDEELVRSLQRIVKSEEIKIDKDALFAIAKLSDKSFRDAAKILEEVFTYTGRRTITSGLINEKFNTLGIGESVSQMLSSLIEKDVKKGLLICRELSLQGMDFKFFIEELIERLHLMLLMEAGVEEDDLVKRFSLSETKKLLGILSQAHQDTKYSVLPQLPLELAVLEWGGEKEESAPSSSSDLDESSNATIPSATLKKTAQQTNSRAINSNSNPSTSSNLFNQFMEEVKNHNHLVAGLLRSCSAEEVRNGKLNIMASSKFHKEKLEEPKNLDLLENSIAQVIGKKIKVSISLKEVK